jgi:hypothetical protein
MKVIELFKNNKNYGLKSINGSLSITTALRPWLLNDLKPGALALNISLLINPDTHLKINEPSPRRVGASYIIPLKSIIL